MSRISKIASRPEEAEFTVVVAKLAAASCEMADELSPAFSLISIRSAQWNGQRESRGRLLPPAMSGPSDFDPKISRPAVLKRDLFPRAVLYPNNVVDQPTRDANMSHTLHKIGVASQIGAYSDAVEVQPNQRWLYTAGTPGLTLDGTISDNIVGQSRQAWNNIIALLDSSGLSIRDIVKVTTTLTSEEYIREYAMVRADFLQGYEPAFMLQIVPALVRSEFLVEVEIVAAKAVYIHEAHACAV
ncbi:RidA family protein [Paraburkholderia sp. 32]|uniref:RidA family protein n=1 Tax=Paraburkholderia sp. 32 TaxID=2991057 RepID=UPI003D246275